MSDELVGARALLRTIALLCVLALTAAYAAQHVLGWQPCQWCVLQRLLLFVQLAVCLTGLYIDRGAAAFKAAGGIALLAAGGAFATLAQHLAAPTSGCALPSDAQFLAVTGLAQLWPGMFEVRGTCAEAARTVLWVPLHLWALALFASLGLLAMLVMAKSPSVLAQLAGRNTLFDTSS